MIWDIEYRVIKVCEFIIENNSTLRKAAKHFGVSKSTIHKDCTERILQIDQTLAECVRKVLNINLDERHIRGGIATRQKYKNKQEKFYKTG